MTTDSFDLYLEFFWELPTARYDGEAEAWRIPKADFEEFVSDLCDTEVSPLLPDGGKQ
jgi:hypothetical protein